MEKQTVVWAIDPFEKETKLDPLRICQLRDWVHTSNYLIQPVYVLSAAEGTREEFSKIAAEKAAEEYLKELKVGKSLPVKILPQVGSSRQEGVSALLEYTTNLQAPWIIVSSHGRSGIHRWVLGSFAENLLLESKCPVYFLAHGSPSRKKNTEMSRVLFATDFSNYSREAFRSVIDQAQRSKLELILFHEVSVPMALLASAGFGTSVLIQQDFLPNQTKWAKEESLQWKKLAESQGVRLRWIVKSVGVASDIGKAILDTAQQEDAEIIAMASVSGAVTSFVIGSVARDVFRANLYPVWIYGPKSFNSKIEA